MSDNIFKLNRDYDNIVLKSDFEFKKEGRDMVCGSIDIDVGQQKWKNELKIEIDFFSKNGKSIFNFEKKAVSLNLGNKLLTFKDGKSTTNHTFELEWDETKINDFRFYIDFKS